MPDTPNPNTAAPAAYPDPQDPGRTTIYEPSGTKPESEQDAEAEAGAGAEADGKTDRGALEEVDGDRPATPSERMAHKLEEEEQPSTLPYSTG